MKNNQNTNNEQNNVNTNNEQNKEGEKKMENKITATDIQTAIARANMARENTDSLIACEYLDTMEEMDTTFSKYNQQTLSEQYASMDKLSDVFTRRHYSPMHSQWDKKNNTFRAVPRVTRFNALDFIKAKKLDTTFPEKIKALSDKLAAFIKSEVQSDGGKKVVPVKEVVPMLQACMDCVGLDGVIARNRDVRFLAYTVSGGSGSIGSLRQVDPARVATMLIDVYAVQLSGGEYDFEKKNTESK